LPLPKNFIVERSFDSSLYLNFSIKKLFPAYAPDNNITTDYKRNIIKNKQHQQSAWSSFNLNKTPYHSMQKSVLHTFEKLVRLQHYIKRFHFNLSTFKSNQTQPNKFLKFLLICKDSTLAVNSCSRKQCKNLRNSKGFQN